MAGPGDELLRCPEGLRAEALHVLYRRAPRSSRAGLVADALDDARRGDLDLERLWVARRRGRLVAAMLTQRLAGRIAAVWAPEVAIRWGRDALAERLIRAALDAHRAEGVAVAQALVDARSPRRAEPDLARGGLRRVTDLIYLARDTGPLPVADGTPPLCWRPYADEALPAFVAALDSTYVDSLDMPELEGIRGLEDVLASHRAGGRFDPGRWQLGTVEGEPDALALALLTAAPDRDAWEVSYLGLSPSARGRGLGRAALAHALDLARPHASRLELAVDARNLPADRLYRAAGFRAFDRRGVYMAVLGQDR